MIHRLLANDHLGLIGLGTFLICTIAAVARADDPPQTGPQTEKRFPPLKVPDGFKATLFACDPLIEYPSAIGLGPKPGSLFVAVDYMTGLGTEIVRRDEIRLIEDTDGDGYADKATVYATGFNSIEGMTFHDGVVYAMHSPLLTALRDTDGDGVADERRNLLTGLGLAPEDNPPRLHCANGITWGFDGWLYLALGDHGCDVPRPEGDRLVFNGGGILRCRTDGRDLHVFSTGLRNIYDVALDDESNVFVRDNENDGGDYKIRVCHSFFGADHGYPYLYYERPDEAMPPLADLGLGSSAGGVAYLEQQFPPEYRGNLFFCEWGRAVMRYVPKRLGAGFAPIDEIEFAAGAENDPYGFKPTDLVVDRDGSLLIADWCDGQRPKRGRARIYRVRYLADNPGATRADAGVDFKRAARSLWAMALTRGQDSLNDLASLASRDPDARVRAQAIRAIADLFDPILANHRLDAARGDEVVANRLAKFLLDRDSRVKLEAIVALGRLRWPAAPTKIAEELHDPDPVLAHAAMQTIRQCANWNETLAILDRPESDAIREIGLRAISDQHDATIVDGLIDRLKNESAPQRRREYADALTRVYTRPAPWTYWGYRPPPRPANTVEWERTPQIKHALNAVLHDPDRSVRLATLRRMQREKIPTIPDTIEAWLADERDPERVAAILVSLKEHPAAVMRGMLLTVVREDKHAGANRLNALAQLAGGLDEASERSLMELADRLEDGPVLAAVLDQAGKRAKLGAGQLLVRKLKSPSAEVRAAAVDALARLKSSGAGDSIRPLLDDRDARVRRAAADAVGKLEVVAATNALLKLATDSDATVRSASLDSLRLLREPRALTPAVAAMHDSQTQLAALACIGEFGSPEHTRLIADATRRNPSAEMIHRAVSIITRWGKSDDLSVENRIELDRAVAELQGTTGVFARWSIRGPLSAEAALQVAEQFGRPGQSVERNDDSGDWKSALPPAADSSFTLRLGPSANAPSDAEWLCLSDVWAAEETGVQFLASSNGTLRVRLNGRSIHERRQAGAFQPDSDRFNGTLVPGLNRLTIQLSASQPPSFHLRFRQKSSRAEHEQLVQAALARPGNAERGRKLFFDAEKSQCIKCHRLGDQGERIGPELTSVGSRFSRIHIIESILEPSRTLAPSYESITVALKDGRVLSGLRVAETATTLTLADNQSQKHVLERSSIEEQKVQPTSIMPDGLEKRFIADEFVDLVAFLVGQK
jgi:putative membrane-bound dehydrogenase-like protein